MHTCFTCCCTPTDDVNFVHSRPARVGEQQQGPVPPGLGPDVNPCAAGERARQPCRRARRRPRCPEGRPGPSGGGQQRPRSAQVRHGEPTEGEGQRDGEHAVSTSWLNWRVDVR